MGDLCSLSLGHPLAGQFPDIVRAQELVEFFSIFQGTAVQAGHGLARFECLEFFTQFLPVFHKKDHPFLQGLPPGLQGVGNILEAKGVRTGAGPGQETVQFARVSVKPVPGFCRQRDEGVTFTRVRGDMPGFRNR